LACCDILRALYRSTRSALEKGSTSAINRAPSTPMRLLHSLYGCECRAVLSLSLSLSLWDSIASVYVSLCLLLTADIRRRNLVTALWFIDQALGNAVQAIVALLPISPEAEYFGYAVAMGGLVGLFWRMNRSFEYREFREASSTESTPLLADDVQKPTFNA
jgi:hypothetical protein